MALRANWHFDAPAPPAGDPFGQMRIEDVGAPIELRDDSVELNQRLVALVNRESELFAAGVVCEVKDLPDTACSACPARGSRGELCQVGCEQERILTALAIARRSAPQT